MVEDITENETLTIELVQKKELQLIEESEAFSCMVLILAQIVLKF